ncbi:MAG: hypothetical protein ACYTBJ_17270 [Planctomycetota bacterium]|jgi:hypothetical protein
MSTDELKPPAVIAGVVEDMQAAGEICREKEPGWHNLLNEWIVQLRAALEQGEEDPCGDCHGLDCEIGSGVCLRDKPAPEPADLDASLDDNETLDDLALHTPPVDAEPADGELSLELAYHVAAQDWGRVRHWNEHDWDRFKNNLISRLESLPRRSDAVGEVVADIRRRISEPTWREDGCVSVAVSELQSWADRLAAPGEAVGQPPRQGAKRRWPCADCDKTAEDVACADAQKCEAMAAYMKAVEPQSCYELEEWIAENTACGTCGQPAQYRDGLVYHQCDRLDADAPAEPADGELQTIGEYDERQTEGMDQRICDGAGVGAISRDSIPGVRDAVRGGTVATRLGRAHGAR